MDPHKRVLRVIDSLLQDRGWAQIGEIAQRLGFNTGVTLGIVRSMRYEGLIIQHEGRGGPRPNDSVTEITPEGRAKLDDGRMRDA